MIHLVTDPLQFPDMVFLDMIFPDMVFSDSLKCSRLIERVKAIP